MSTFTLEYMDTEEEYERWLADKQRRRLAEVIVLRDRQRALSDELESVNLQLNMLGANDG